MSKRLARDAQVIKWLVFFVAIFIFSVLAGPLFAVGCWLDRDASELWLDTVGTRLLERWVKGCEL